VFQDDPKAPHVIQTVPKGGYRLIAAVAAVATGAGVKAEARSKRRYSSVESDGCSSWRYW
jgi:DNA-binding winged helix-turn-helix (wHTH) protein